MDSPSEQDRLTGTALPTALGIGSILMWGSTIAFSRSLAEELGTLTSGALMLGVGGGAAVA